MPTEKLNSRSVPKPDQHDKGFSKDRLDRARHKLDYRVPIEPQHL